VSEAVAAAARELIARYGGDAPVIAVMRAAEAAALGDLETCEHWEQVAEACDGPVGPVQ
jgi:hypothetical protein